MYGLAELAFNSGKVLRASSGDKKERHPPFMTTAQKRLPSQKEQQTLCRPVCGAINADQVCVLLGAHPGKHVSSKGKQW